MVFPLLTPERARPWVLPEADLEDFYGNRFLDNDAAPLKNQISTFNASSLFEHGAPHLHFLPQIH